MVIIEPGQEYPELEQVVTMAEAARLVHMDPTTLRLAIDRGRVAALQCGRIWLVSVRSLQREYANDDYKNSAETVPKSQRP